jgi:peptidoglycan/xylan/chitin deacetylase (PgdA/CDA1 family)
MAAFSGSLLMGCLDHGESAPAEPHESALPTASIAPASSASAPSVPVMRPQLDGRGFPDKVLALTWDDGPDTSTLELARFLRAEHVSATFFVVSAWVSGVSSEPGRGRDPYATGSSRLPILGELVALGHRLGNHTLNHVLLSDADAPTVRAQLRENQAILDRWISNDLRLFRAPGGAWNAAASAAVDTDPALRALVGPVRWDIDGKDWEGSLYCRSSKPQAECEPAAPEREARVKPAVIAERYLAQIESAGHGIVLLHDRVGHVGSGYALRVAKLLVPQLVAKGYVFAAPVLRFSAPAAREGVALDAIGRRDRLRGDLNGDGRADACEWTRSGLMCSLATAHAATKATNWLPEVDEAHGWTARQAATLALVDVNGDGRADVCGRGPRGTVCAMAP